MDLSAPQPEIEHHLVWPTLTLLTPTPKIHPNPVHFTSQQLSARSTAVNTDVNTQ